MLLIQLLKLVNFTYFEIGLLLELKIKMVTFATNYSFHNQQYYLCDHLKYLEFSK
jgi:hypothetical protein